MPNNYPKHDEVNIIFKQEKPTGEKVAVAPDPVKIQAGGTLTWKCTGNVVSFTVKMKTSSTPFVDGKTESKGKTATAEPVDDNAEQDLPYAYEVTCTDKDGNDHTLDPDIVVGPRTR